MIFCFFDKKKAKKLNSLECPSNIRFHTSFLQLEHLQLSSTYNQQHISIANREDKLICISHARFDGQTQLSNQLELNTKKTNSAQIVLNAYLKWGNKCTDFLIGDWSFIIWDNQKQELFVSRDHIGSASLFYYNSPDIFICSSNLNTLLSHHTIQKKINPIAFLQTQRGISKDNQTFYKDIFQLLPAHTLTITLQSLQLKNYWLPSKKKDIFYKKDEEYILHFLDIYQQSVQDRLGNNTGVSLSSGLDSTSTAFFAASKLNEESRILKALTWRPKNSLITNTSPNRFYNEMPLAKKFAKKFSNIEHIEVIGKSHNIVSNIKQCLDIFGQPKNFNIHMQEVYKSAQMHGVETMLTGEWGNLTVSYKGERHLFFKKMLLSGRTSQLLEAMYQWKKHHKIGWSKMLYYGLLEPFLYDFKNRYSRKKKDVLNILNPIAVQDNIENSQSNTSHLNEFIRKGQTPNIHIIMAMRDNYLGNLEQFSNHYGIESRTPAMDKRMIDFCLGIPHHQFIHNGEQKWLIKRAMKGKLPNEILFSNKRGMQGGDLLNKYKQEINEIKIIITQIKKSPLVRYWIDFQKLEQAIKEIEIEPVSAKLLMKTFTIKKGLTLGLFLLKFENE